MGPTPVAGENGSAGVAAPSWPASVLRHYSGAARSEISVPLGLLQRILLTTDGTVTHILEAFTGEPIEVVKLSQTLGPWHPHESAISLTPADTVMRRSVLLRGRWSGRNLLHGDSIVAYDRIAPDVRAGLLDTDKGIGRVLFENHVETFREIIGWGEEPAGPFAAELGIDAEAALLFRTYRIMCQGRPIMLITERFTAAGFVGDGAPAPPVAAVAQAATEQR